MDKYKVAIVDDDEVALENLSFELGKDARFSLKGTARNGKQGKKLIAKVQPEPYTYHKPYRKQSACSMKHCHVFPAVVPFLSYPAFPHPRTTNPAVPWQ